MTSGPNTLLLMLRLVLSLGVVLAVVGAAVWALKRRGPLRGAGGRAASRLEVLDRRALSKHAAVAVVRSGPRTFLVGVTDQQVSVLGEWDGGDIQLGGDQLGADPDGAPAVAAAGATEGSLRGAIDGGATADTGATGAALPPGEPAAAPAAVGPGTTPAVAALAAALSRPATARSGQRRGAPGWSTADQGIRRTGSLLSTTGGAGGDTESRMGFVEALREMTVRRS
jgi:flagellar biosynthetic protein FliO